MRTRSLQSTQQFNKQNFKNRQALRVLSRIASIWHWTFVLKVLIKVPRNLLHYFLVSLHAQNNISINICFRHVNCKHSLRSPSHIYRKRRQIPFAFFMSDNIIQSPNYPYHVMSPSYCLLSSWICANYLILRYLSINFQVAKE